jgi:hypothetical protein
VKPLPHRIFRILDTEPAIPSSGGAWPTTCMGRVTFSGVSFAYPTRSDVQVLQDFNLTVEPNQTVALVGTSGSGAVVVFFRLGNSCVAGVQNEDGTCALVDGSTTICGRYDRVVNDVLSYVLVCVTYCRQVYCAVPAGALLRRGSWLGDGGRRRYSAD